MHPTTEHVKVCCYIETCPSRGALSTASSSSSRPRLSTAAPPPCPRAAAPGRSTSGCRRRVEAHHRAVDIETMLKDTSPVCARLAMLAVVLLGPETLLRNVPRVEVEFAPLITVASPILGMLYRSAWHLDVGVDEPRALIALVCYRAFPWSTSRVDAAVVLPCCCAGPRRVPSETHHVWTPRFNIMLFILMPVVAEVALEVDVVIDEVSVVCEKRDDAIRVKASASCAPDGRWSLLVANTTTTYQHNHAKTHPANPRPIGAP
ncbi:unnamed protein product [Prorocentrum cordatum]|uniref:Uncharacterized protein n=1 Tax=Prorocentrum cordatum TaxID=2364126 RepID=A0ABN9T596_9DINO|nr:unnamed protein product [Polarella glacialis]